jgi:hypothetical protein
MAPMFGISADYIGQVASTIQQAVAQLGFGKVLRLES